MHAKHAALELSKADANNDGNISREEWVAKYGSEEGFEGYDLVVSHVIYNCALRAGAVLCVCSPRCGVCVCRWVVLLCVHSPGG